MELGVEPDLTCLGKIIGGGLPVGAYGGRREIMEQIAPLGPVYQAGTLSGNPLAMAAGAATLTALQEPGVYADLEEKAAYLCRGLAEAAAAAGYKVWVVERGKAETRPKHRPDRRYKVFDLAGEALGKELTEEQAAPERMTAEALGERGGICLTRAGSMLSQFFVGQPVFDYRSAMQADTERYARYFGPCLRPGLSGSRAV